MSFLRLTPTASRVGQKKREREGRRGEFPRRAKRKVNKVEGDRYRDVCRYVGGEEGNRKGKGEGDKLGERRDTD